VKTSRKQITFLEKESNDYHLSDNDGDEVALAHPGRRHDVEHHTTIDRRALTFEEHALAESCALGETLMGGRCRLVASG
jgi:hypothetical protein